MVQSYSAYKKKLICESFDDLKKSTDFSPEQKETLDKIASIVNKHREEKRSALGVLDSFIDKYDTCTCVITGGLNGPGKWENYLEDISKLVKDFEENGIHVWMIEGENDCLDDVFTFNFGVKKKKDNG